MEIFNITKTLSLDHLQYLFEGDEDFLKKLKIDNISIYSITPYKEAQKINKILLKYISVNSTITDMTACVGGNTVSFCKTFKHVNAIEICKERFNFLQENLKLYQLENVSYYNEDCMKIIDTLTQDIIYIDGPWGGRNYKYKDKVNLFLSGKYLHTIVNMLKGKSKFILLKVPNNFDIDKFRQKVKSEYIKIYQLEKFQIIVIKN